MTGSAAAHALPLCVHADSHYCSDLCTVGLGLTVEDHEICHPKAQAGLGYDNLVIHGTTAVFCFVAHFQLVPRQDFYVARLHDDGGIYQRDRILRL